MNRNNKNDDMLKSIFQRLPENDLPSSFRERIMQQVVIEAAKKKKRNVVLTISSLTLASVIMLAFAVVSIIYMDLPKLEIDVKELTSLPFYLYIGTLVILLLGGDHILRKKYLRKHSNDTQ